MEIFGASSMILEDQMTIDEAEDMIDEVAGVQFFHLIDSDTLQLDGMFSADQLSRMAEIMSRIDTPSLEPNL